MQTSRSLNVSALLQRVASARFKAEERTQHSDLTSVLAVSNHIGAQAPTEGILASIAEEAARLLKSDNAAFRLVDGDELVLAGCAGTAAEPGTRQRIRSDEGAPGRIVQKGEALVIDLLEDEAARTMAPDVVHRLDYTHYLGVPLKVGDRTVGVLGTMARHRFSSRDVEVARAFASQAAVAIEHARLYREAARRAQQMRGLADLGQFLSGTLDPHVVGERIAESLRALLGTATAALYRAHPGTEGLLLSALAGAQITWGAWIPMGQRVTDLALRERRPQASADVVADLRVVLSPAVRARIAESPFRAALAAPLVIGEHVLGALLVVDRVGREFDDDEVKLAGAFADHAALALQNARLHEAALTGVKRLEALVEVNRVVGSTLDHRAVAARVVEAAGQLVPDCVSVLWETVPEGGEMLRIADSGARRPGSMQARLRFDEGLAGAATAARRRIVSTDLARDPRIENTQWFEAEGLASGVALPLLHAGVEYGALCLFARTRYEFTEDEISLLESFAAQVAAAIANARTFGREEERARRLATLTEVTQLITSASDSREVFDAVTMAASSLLGASFARLLVHDPGENVLRTEGAFSADRTLAEEIRRLPPIPIQSGLAGEAFCSRQPVYVRDVEQDARSLLQDVSTRFGLHAAALIPLRTRDRVVGVLSIGFAEARDFAVADKELMNLLADQAAIAISNKRGEEELRTLASETGNILASIPSILIAVDRHDRVTRWNAAAETALGIPPSRVLGRPLLESGIDWDWPSVLERIAECRRQRVSVRLDDLRYQRPDGKEGFLALTVNPIEGETDVWDFLILGSDVTERRILEAQLSQAQKLESIGQLAAGIAHEINTPIQFVGDNVRFLQGALGDLQRLLAAYQCLREVPDDAALVGEVRAIEDEIDVTYLSEEMPKAVAQTLEGVQRVSTIVRALKEFAHPDRKERVATDLNQALLSTLTVARNEIKYVADVETDLGELPPVMCHAGELNQVFLNIFINAAHAIGDVTRGIGGKGRIRVQTRREGEHVVVAINDTGGGIPEAIRSRVFDPFFTTKGVGRGTGQGLAIARNVVVDKHGGALTFESETGRGTTFYIRLPLNGTPPPAPPAPGAKG